MKNVLFPKSADPDLELLALREDLTAAQRDLQLAYHQFNQVIDPELVEASIYEISAVKARCNYLIRAIKEHCPTDGAAAANLKEDAKWS